MEFAIDFATIVGAILGPVIACYALLALGGSLLGFTRTLSRE